MKNTKLKLAVASLVVSVLILGACKNTETIQNGSKVSFHYTLTADGKVADSSIGKSPYEYEHGAGGIIPGLEEKMMGLKKGDKRTFTIPPEKAYGIRNKDAFMKIPKTSIKGSEKLKEGSMIGFTQGGKQYTAVVSKVEKGTITLDYNHPMADKTLVFEIEVIEVDNTVKK
ncbi:MAG TPA: peptidylprolyl isomerase [Elusimicrobiales bacterium]|nr:peptidylprolyl isomerase [Elusimicrobiales bacterium]